MTSEVPQQSGWPPAEPQEKAGQAPQQSGFGLFEAPQAPDDFPIFTPYGAPPARDPQAPDAYGFPPDAYHPVSKSGRVNLLPVNVNIWLEGRRPPRASLLRGGWEVRDVLPGVESLPHLLAVLRSRAEVPSGTEVLGNRPIRREEALGVTR